MSRRSIFEHYLRTGRWVDQPLETKFNPWHDPKDGRFTFAGQGVRFGNPTTQMAMAKPTGRFSPNQAKPTRSQKRPAAKPAPIRPAHPLPANSTRANPPASKPNPPNPLVRVAAHQPIRKPGASQDSARVEASVAAAAARMRAEQAGSKMLREVHGYPQTGTLAWRSANDAVFIKAAADFNRARGLNPGDSKYIDPQLMRAWAMVESGGSKSEFLRDPFQANIPGDWTEDKFKQTGLVKYQTMNPYISAEAALRWLNYRGYIRDKNGQPGSWLGIEGALRRYNGRTTRRPDGLEFRAWYAKQILSLYRG